MNPENFSYLSIFTDIFILEIRPAIAFGIAPFFGFQSILGLSKRAIFVMLTMITYPILWPIVYQKLFTPIQVISMAMHELLIGAIIGFVVAIPFWAIESAGQMIDLQRGTTAASIFNPQFGAISSPFGNLLLRFFSTYFYATGGFILFLGLLFISYEYFPLLGNLPNLGTQPEIPFLELLSLFFELTMIYVSPFLVSFLLIDFGFGLMNRFVPSLNVFFFALPIKSVVGFLLLKLALVPMITHFHNDIFALNRLINILHRIFFNK